MRTLVAIALVASLAAAQDAAKARALLDQGKAQEAADAARALVEKTPADTAAWAVLAKAHLALNDPFSALEALEKGTKANPKDAGLRLDLADVLKRIAEVQIAEQATDITIRGYYLDARRVYEEAMALDESAAPRALHGMADVSHQLGESDVARQHIAKCLAIHKDYAPCHALLGQIFYDEKQYAQAEVNFEVARRLDDSDPLVGLRYGHSLYAQGKFDQAKAAYIETLRRHPDYEIALQSGLYHVVGQDWTKGVAVLQEAVKAAPESHVAWFYLGYAHFLNRAFNDAKVALEKAVAMDASKPRYHFYLGQAHEGLGETEAALECYRAAVKLAPYYDDAVYAFQSLIPFGQDFEAAVRLLDELTTLAPNNALVVNNYALLLRDWAEARGATKPDAPPEVQDALRRSAELYERAAELLPEDPQIASDTGLLFEFYPTVRNDEKARGYFTHSLDLSDYVYRDAFDGLNRLCRRTGDWQTLADYAESVVGAIERGKNAVAPRGGGAPEELPGQETAALKARAQQALKEARARLAAAEPEK